MPKRVRSSPASERIGISVPMAVVAVAAPGEAQREHHARRGQQPAEPEGEREREEPAERPQAERLARMRWKSIS